MKEVAVFLSASETHNKKNVNKTIADDAGRVRGGHRRRRWRRACACAPTSRRCTAARTRARSTRSKVVELCRGAARRSACYQVSLGDTIGVATPRQVRDVLERRAGGWRRSRRSRCTSTTRAARRWRTCSSPSSMGITTVDTASVGWAAVPTRPAPRGNLATEDVVYMLHGMGIEHGHRSRRAGGLLVEARRCRRARDAVEVHQGGAGGARQGVDALDIGRVGAR